MLRDQTRIVRDEYSNDLKDDLPGAIAALYESIHDFSSEIDLKTFMKTSLPRCTVYKIITSFEGCLAEVRKWIVQVGRSKLVKEFFGERQAGSHPRHRAAHRPLYGHGRIVYGD